MEKTQNNLLRNLAISLLSQENGIDGRSYEFLRELLWDADEIDIITAVDATDDGYYLPEDHNFTIIE